VENTTNKKSRLSLVMLTAGAFFAFFVFGFADNLKGPVIPEMLSSLHLSYSTGSNILLLSYLGFMVATLIAGPLADRLGNRSVMAMAGLVLTIGIGWTGFAGSVSILHVSFFLLGFGLGTIEIAANGIIVETYPEKNGFYLNILAFFHGAGSMVAPLFAGKMIADGGQWNDIYKVVFFLPLILFISFAVARFSKNSKLKVNSPIIPGKGPGIIKIFNKELILFSILMVSYVAVEIGIASWIVEFLQKVKGFSVVKSSLFLSLYFAFLTAGRLLGSAFVDRIGHIKILRIVSVSSVLIMTLGIFTPSSFAVILPFTGFFFSIMFPTLTASAAERHNENRGTVFGILFFFAGLGGMIGPWIVGSIADISGIKVGMATVILFPVIMSVVLFLISPKKNNEN
jgi:FHS family glucose/mannose:H+ symporter-like MFS transporter